MDFHEMKHIVSAMVETGMDMVRTCSVKDVAIFKFALITFGMLFTLANYKACKKAAPLLVLIFIACYAYLIANYVLYLKDIKDNL